jgi:hypothetical protein
MADWTTPSAVHSKCGEDSGHEAVLSIDDNLATYWIHSPLVTHWIIFDMGETKKITQIRLYQVLHYPWGGNANVNVYVGDDPANLGAAVWTGNLGSTTGWHESGVFEKNGRYVKLATTSNVSEQRMYEFDAMAEAVAGGPIERAVTESLGSISDDTTQLLRRDRQISESSISVADSPSPNTRRVVSISEPSISITDSPAYVLRRDRSLSEPTITISDEVIRVFWGYRMVSEPSISASDDVSAEKISGLVREVNEPAISVSDVIVYFLQRIINISEPSISMSDDVLSVAYRSVSISEVSVGVSDSTGYMFYRGREIAESLGLVSDGIGYTVRHVVSVSEPTISVSDVVYAGIFGKVVKVKIFLIIGDLAIQLTGA